MIQDSLISDLFRRWGYLEADIDPLRTIAPHRVEELHQAEGEEAEHARACYCGTIGIEFMHILEHERREWIQEKMESDRPKEDQESILRRLVSAEVFEQVLQHRYPGTKRFSLEGLSALIPLLDETLETAAREGAQEIVIGMSHRGRLNVMLHIVGTNPVDLFTAFEDVDPRSVLGGGDVKYHHGATGNYRTKEGRTLSVRMVSNPSHLEAVDPVALGRVKAKQTRDGSEGEKHIVSVLIHGDAAFAGQGIAAETLNLSAVDGYSVGGTLHIVVDNLIGFTAGPGELYSSRFSTDVAKRLPIPIIHVNAEDPDAVVYAARMAAEYRFRFRSDCVLHLIGYRRHGHSEVDDPTVTQPLLYKKIKDHPPLWKLYAERTGIDAAEEESARRRMLEAEQSKSQTVRSIPRLSVLPEYWSGYSGGPYEMSTEPETGLDERRLAEIVRALTETPEGFSVHPKVRQLLERRAKMGAGEAAVDFGMAELLAFGSLLQEGVSVRLSGQDSQRGTFGHRHAVLIDTENEHEYVPLRSLCKDRVWCTMLNSILSEAAVLGFEYGFSREYPDALVAWEAQFGDFANGAQLIIDQFISASEDKWALLSGIVLLLPHGYEGQGAEHSSARMERFLQLAGEDNIQICQPSTSAQYFHLLRRQMLRSLRKPLIVFTPKSMLRSAEASSDRGEFLKGTFQRVIPDHDIADARRVLVCTGKIGHELRAERKRRHNEHTAVVMLEQLYPFPEAELASELSRHIQAREVLWVQEEPANMGALAFVLPLLERASGSRPVRSVRRSASASPATGSAKAHQLEQRAILGLAFHSTEPAKSQRMPSSQKGS
ncbi:MAG: 2-oxoglutarate dehydrogenase E1 component [Acidobacteriota bacterium]